MRRPCGDVHGHGIGAARKNEGCQVHDRARVQIIFVGFYGLIKKRHTLF